jgi:DNA-binding protein H-NS
MLNQGRTEEIGNRTEQIEDRLALERQKNQQDQESLRHAIKQLNERMNRLETNPVVMGQNVIAPLKEGSKRDLKDPSRQDLKDAGKL